jgi:starch synthase
MDIVFVSPEVAPFSKVGGLADVVAALPKALRALGHKVTVLSLRYGSVDPQTHALARRLTKLKVPLGDEVVEAELYEARLVSGVNVCLIGAPGISDRPGVYGENGEAYPDNARRFGFLARAAVEWMRAQPRCPDIAHLHDWTTGLVPLFLREDKDPKLANVKTVFTLHNLAHQGIFPASTLKELGIPMSYAAVSGLEFWGEVSWMKAAAMFSDRFVTVSPSYAKEILTTAGGVRMDGVLRTHAKGLVGILNGIDPAVWNPSTDPNLIARYDAHDATAKARCKTDLQQRVGLPVRPETPVLGMVARLDLQKGVDLLLDVADRLLRQDVQLVLQGSGNARLVEAASALARDLPEKVAFTADYNDTLAHRIYGGADLFLMPSRFEPCGLTHLYAMRYGAVPVVHDTGGLRDTVVDCDPALRSGTGFLFGDATAESFYGGVSRALTAYQNADGFTALRRRVMRQEWSWDRSARRYQGIYAELTPRSADETAATV